MGFLIDTSVFIQIERSGFNLDVILVPYQQQEMLISVITVSELLTGIHRATIPAFKVRRQDFVKGVLASFPVLPIDESIAHIHARITAELTSSGKMIGINDSWLAATCLAHQLSIATANVREFGRVPGLIVENWKV